MSASWYLIRPDGARFNWNKAPTFQCPNADAVTYTAAEDGGEGTWTLQVAISVIWDNSLKDRRHEVPRRRGQPHQAYGRGQCV
jgi:hypothetical protein